jgi:IclR family acetate operon transcriptional repressor
VATPSPGSTDRVAGVARALKLLEIITLGPPEGMNLTELAKRIEISKSSTLALLRTMTDAGFVRTKEPGPRYLPGMTLLRLGDLSRTTQPIDEIAQAYIPTLAQEIGMTIRVAINDGGRPVFISRADAPGSVRFHTMLGAKEIPSVSSAGKAILANLSDEEIKEVIEETGLPSRTKHSHTTLASLMRDINQVRARGYAIDDEEDVDGIFCIGAPFFDHTGRCGGAISATGIKTATRQKRTAYFGAQVVKCADAITKELHGRRVR